MPKQDENTRMREASGAVSSDCRLAGFLYLLCRDVVPVGRVEEVLGSVMGLHAPVVFTNGWLAEWAIDAANRLKQAMQQGTEPEESPTESPGQSAN